MATVNDYARTTWQTGDVIDATKMNNIETQLDAVTDNARDNGTAPVFSTTKTYAVGEHVLYNGEVYKCKTAVTNAGAWVASNWVKAYLSSDMEGEVSELKSALIYNANKNTLWEQGTINSNSGNNNNSNSRIRTIGYLDKNIYAVTPLSGYKTIIAAYSGGTFQGMWTGTELYIGGATALSERVVLSDIGQYDFRVVLLIGNTTNISSTDYDNVVFEIVTDETLTKSGKAADAKVIGDRLTELGNDIEELEGEIDSEIEILNNKIFDTENYVRISKIPGVTFINGSSNKSVTYISVNNLTTYDTYYKIVEKETELWFDNPTSPYVSLCVGDSFTSEETQSDGTLRLYCSNSVRYRKSDDNLPTENNKVTVHAGGIFVVTLTAGYDDIIYGINHEIIRKTFAREAAVSGVPDALNVAISTDTVEITSANYSVVFKKITTEQGYQWNIKSLSKPNGDNVLPSSTDIIGVIKFDGENNFMGGVHGNESNIDFTLWAEGSQIVTSGYYKNVRVWMNSHLYSVNDPTANVVDRYVMFLFDENGWKCRNTFKILSNATVNVSYASGLFGFSLSDVNFASCNLGPIPLTLGSRMYEKPEFRQVFINFTSGLSVTLRSSTSKKGFLTYRETTSSAKAYFVDVENQAFTAGDYITGESEYIF